MSRKMERGLVDRAHLAEHLGQLHAGVHAAGPGLGLEAELPGPLRLPPALDNRRQLRKGKGGRGAQEGMLIVLWGLTR